MGRPAIDNAISVKFFNIVEAQSALLMASQIFYFSLGFSNFPILIASTLQAQITVLISKWEDPESTMRFQS